MTILLPFCSNITDKFSVEAGDFLDYHFKRDHDGKPYINPNSVSFFLSPTGPGEIELIINSLQTNKSAGPNSIPISTLQRFNISFSVWLSKLIKLPFEIGIFPDLLKIVQITPIVKKGSKLDLFFIKQFGFRSGYSILHALISITEGIRELLDSKHYVCGVFVC